VRVYIFGVGLRRSAAQQVMIVCGRRNADSPPVPLKKPELKREALMDRKDLPPPPLRTGQSHTQHSRKSAKRSRSCSLLFRPYLAGGHLAPQLLASQQRGAGRALPAR